MTAILSYLKTHCCTLRFRLMAWNVMLVIVTAVAVLASLRQGVKFALYHELDQLHLEDSQQIALMLEEQPVDYTGLYQSLQQHADGHHQHGWFVVLFDRNANVLWASDNGPAEALRPAPTVPDRQVTEVDGIRFLRRRLPEAAGAIQAFHVGSHLQSIRTNMAHVDRQVAIAAGVVLVLAPPCGYWLAGRMTRPLSEMTTASVHLRPIFFDERLPLRGTGDELDQLAATINALLDRIAGHLERKQDFLANAAHELRTPLAAIRSSIEVTLNEPRGVEEYEELLDELIEENAHLEKLVNQLLLLSETEAEGRFDNSRPIDLEACVQRSVDMFRGAAEAQGVTLASSLQPCRVQGNLDHLRQVVNNLLDNAIKFTPAGGRVDVTVRRASTENFAQIIVADTGLGIPAADLPRIFERFFRCEYRGPEEERPRGTGLGLCICEAIVTTAGGTIQLESEPDRGTTVTVRLPLGQPRETVGKDTPPVEEA